MNITLTKQTGLKGVDTTKSWTASLLNDEKIIVVKAHAITASGALRELKRVLEEALQAVEEMDPTSTPASGETKSSGRHPFSEI